jgi:hypothetical protein
MPRNLHRLLSNVSLQLTFASLILMGAEDKGLAGYISNYSNWVIKVDSCVEGVNFIYPTQVNIKCTPASPNGNIEVSLTGEHIESGNDLKDKITDPADPVLGGTSQCKDGFGTNANMIINPNIGLDACHPTVPANKLGSNSKIILPIVGSRSKSGSQASAEAVFETTTCCDMTNSKEQFWLQELKIKYTTPPKPIPTPPSPKKANRKPILK